MSDSIYGIRFSVEKLHEWLEPYFSERFQVIDAEWDSDRRALKIRLNLLDRKPYREQLNQITYFASVIETTKVDSLLSEYRQGKNE